WAIFSLCFNSKNKEAKGYRHKRMISERWLIMQLKNTFMYELDDLKKEYTMAVFTFNAKLYSCTVSQHHMIDERKGDEKNVYYNNKKRIIRKLLNENSVPHIIQSSSTIRA
ncbi:hypothetical protein ACJX0J_011590, partial [Zea mays]